MEISDISVEDCVQDLLDGTSVETDPCAKIHVEGPVRELMLLWGLASEIN